MKKRTYRAVAVKEFDGSVLAQQLAGQARLIVGLDVAKASMYAVLMNVQEQILGVLKWDHLSESRWVTCQLMSLPVSSVEVVMESSGTYGDALQHWLRETGAQLFRVHPKHTKDAHELYDGVPSRHDAKCSAILAWLHLLNRSEPWLEASEYDRALSAAVHLQELHSRAFRQATGHLEALLARHWPELPHLLKLDSASLLELVHGYGSPKRVCGAAAAARSLLRQAGRGGLSEKKIEQVIDSARYSVGVPLLECERQALVELAGEARRRQQAMQAAQRRLRSLAQQERSTQRIGMEVGPVTAAVLHQALGCFFKYPNTGSLLKAAGLNLKERSSGQHQGRLSITKRGSCRARQYLYLAVLRWIRDDPWVRAWHERKVKRDGGLKRKSLIALMRKLLRGLWWVARGESLDTTKLFDIQRLAGAQ